jgi:Protein of unknown function (DUF3761)
MKNTNLVGFVAAPFLVFALSLPAWAADSTDAAPTTCKDGTTSTATGKGACSGHGGVQKAAKTTAAATTPAPAAAAPAAPAAPAASGTTPKTCTDGTTSTATGKGACSGHGGVQKASKTKPATTTPAAPAAAAPAAAAPAASAAPAAAKTSTATKSAPTATASNTDPTGATAKCKDGTYSKSQHHSGTCSSHGGVAEWLTAQ